MYDQPMPQDTQQVPPAKMLQEELRERLQVVQRDLTELRSRIELLLPVEGALTSALEYFNQAKPMKGINPQGGSIDRSL
jgi:hypothetical protein